MKKTKRPRRMTEAELRWFREASQEDGTPSLSVYWEVLDGGVEPPDGIPRNHSDGGLSYGFVAHIDAIAVQLCAERSGLASGETRE